MKKVIALILCLVLLVIYGIAFAEDSIDLSKMSTIELSQLRDTVSQEINSRKTEDAVNSIVIENEYITLEITGIEVVDKATVNDYYDQYQPGTGTTDDCPFLVLLFTLTNHSEESISSIKIKEASINGWMVSSYTGIRSISAGKRAKGFIDAKLIDCDAERMEDINSFEFRLVVRNDGGDEVFTEEISLISTETGWILE